MSRQHLCHHEIIRCHYQQQQVNQKRLRRSAITWIKILDSVQIPVECELSLQPRNSTKNRQMNLVKFQKSILLDQLPELRSNFDLVKSPSTLYRIRNMGQLIGSLGLNFRISSNHIQLKWSGKLLCIPHFLQLTTSLKKNL